MADTPTKNSRSYSSIDSVLNQIIELADIGKFQEALSLAETSEFSRDAKLINARGVCLLRSSRSKEAVSLYRSLVVAPGISQLRPDLPVIYYTNFCLALIMEGQIRGCRETMFEIEDQLHPSVFKLRDVFNTWHRSLTFLEKLNWALGGEPTRPFALTDPIGELTDPARFQHQG